MAPGRPLAAAGAGGARGRQAEEGREIKAVGGSLSHEDTEEGAVLGVTRVRRPGLPAARAHLP